MLNYLQIKLSKKDVIYYSLLLLFSFSMGLSAIEGDLKYLKYTLPVGAIFLLFSISKYIRIERDDFYRNQRFKYIIGLTIFYLSACFFNLFKAFSLPRFYQEVFFILSPLSFAMILLLLRPKEDYKKAVILLFWGISIAFIIENFVSIIQVIFNLNLVIEAFVTSEMPTESNYAFEFGLFFIFFSYKNMKRYSIISLFFLLLSFKRIAIFGCIIYLLLFLVRKLSRNHIDFARNKNLILVINCIIISILFSFFAGAFDDIIENNLGVTSNFLTQGRYNIYQDIFAHFGKIDLFGFGLGSINVFLSNKGYDLVNLHSDLLKVFFEFGPLIFVAWIFFFHKWTNSFLSSSLAIYINVLFLTDNVFIYFDVMFVFYILMFCALDITPSLKRMPS